MNKEEAKQKLHNMAFVKLDTRPNDLNLADVMQIVNQIDELVKVTIPKFVAVWIESCKVSGFSLRLAMSHWSMSEKLDKWMEYSENQEIFAKAWFYGYTVEKPKLYTVEIPNPNIDKSHITVLKRMKDSDNDIELCIFVRPDLSESKFHLTESEIRKDFEWAWKWAEPVEELKNEQTPKEKTP